MGADFIWLLDALKLSTRFVLPVALTLGVFLFAPDVFIGHIGLADLRKQHQSYLGAAFVLSSCILASRGIIHGGAWARQKYRKHATLKLARASLHHLTPEEQDILRRYLEGNTKTLLLSIDCGVVASLSKMRIINQSTRYTRHGIDFPHNIHEWAWDYLHDHPELVGLAPGTIPMARNLPPGHTRERF